MRGSLLAVVFACMSVEVHAGMTYEFRSVTAGAESRELAGTVSVEGGSFRIDILKGNFPFLTSGTTILSRDGMKSVDLVDSRARTYTHVSLEEVLTAMGSLARSAGDLIKIAVENPQVRVSPLGSGGLVEGFPTRRTLVTSRYTLSIEMMGMKGRRQIEAKTQSWTTDRIPRGNVTFLQTGEMKTGMEALDKVLATESTDVGGFPLKVVRTQTSTEGKRVETTTTTMTVSKVKVLGVAANRFAVPQGYVLREFSLLTPQRK